MVGRDRLVMVFVDICEQRDVKGMYAKARSREIKGFTGIDDPYESPVDPDIVLDTTTCWPEDNARRIVEYLLGKGFVERNLQAVAVGL